MTEDTIRTITMQGHPPIRTHQEPEELWLGYPDRDFGGMYLRAVRTRDGRLILWYRYNSPNTAGHSYNQYIATLPAVASAAGTLDQARANHRDLGALLDRPDEYGMRGQFLGNRDVSNVQAWLADLGYAMLAEID
jgi:hypothetical protein